MLQNRSLLPKVEVLSRKGDKTSICCIKLLQSVWNFYHHKITKKCRGRGGEYPQPPLKRLHANFCQPRNDPFLLWPKKLKGGRGEGGAGVVHSDQIWGRHISVRGQNFSAIFSKHITLNFTKYECQCNTITFNVLMRAALIVGHWKCLCERGTQDFIHEK